MPVIGWVFILLALALVLGSLFMLRDSSMRIPPEKLKKIRKRKAELEAKEKAEEEDR
ncbi:DUF2897 family protein [Marinobacter changyiensis]|uniref:DUF2897 family protein n=1 Tax=Marinobacter changyiensis TaxID=2604091 RepID=UPI00126578D4|nr:DUF2897 family protein [Marinobacter changyiensis]